MMDNIFNAVIYPNCGETWATNDINITEKECKCFRCGKKYIPKRIIKMWDFVYYACKTIKGK